MANEAVPIQILEDRLIEMTVAEGTTRQKGTIMKLSDPNVASASSADGEFFAGIASTEKVGGDSSTRLALWRHGVFDLKLTNATVAAGEPVKIAGANLVALADDDTIGNKGEIVGIALQNGAANEVIQVLVGGV